MTDALFWRGSNTKPVMYRALHSISRLSLLVMAPLPCDCHSGSPYHIPYGEGPASDSSTRLVTCLQVKGAFQATGDKADEMRAKAPGSKDVKGEARSVLDTAEDAAIRTKFACCTVSAVLPQQLCDRRGGGGGGGGNAFQIPQCADVGCSLQSLQSQQQGHACMATVCADLIVTNLMCVKRQVKLRECLCNMQGRRGGHGKVHRWSPDGACRRRCQR